MTIDEAIKFCEENSKRVKLKVESQLFIQIAEWLEELKALKEKEEKFDRNIKFFEKVQWESCKAGYTKAIDDFVNTCEKKLTDMILTHQKQLDFVSGLAVAGRMLDDVAEQLKEEV